MRMSEYEVEAKYGTYIIITLLVFMALAFVFGFAGDFLTEPQTGVIAGYPFTMSGIAWVGVGGFFVGMSAFFVVALILYVKHKM